MKYRRGHMGAPPRITVTRYPNMWEYHHKHPTLAGIVNIERGTHHSNYSQ